MPSVHREFEVKYEVDDGFELPSLTGLVPVDDGGAPVAEGEAGNQRLEATYFDTPDFCLARAQLTLRRRTGGPDAGWHLKVPRADGGRQEVRLPPGRKSATVPARLRDMVWARTLGDELTPVARIVTERTTHHLVDATGQVLVEVADDRVRAERLSAPRPSGVAPQAWREIEVEVRGGDRSLLDTLDSGLRAIGLRVAHAPSKLARVLNSGGEVIIQTTEDGQRARPSPKSPAGDVVLRYLTQQVEQILVSDVRVRLDTPDSVHQMRVASRRLRSALQTFKPVLSPEVVTPLREELKWLAGELGAARDAEVLRDRMLAAVHEEDREVHLGPLGDTVETELTQAYRSAHDGLLRSMNGERYHQLVIALDQLVSAPPFTAAADRSAAQVLPKRAKRAYTRLGRLVAVADDAPTPAERDHHLHEARKAAKKARYAGELLTGAFGKPAARFATAMESLQEELGEHQDSVVMRARLEELARAEPLPAAAFAYGRLHAQQERRGEVAIARFQDAWPTATKKALRSWMN